MSLLSIPTPLMLALNTLVKAHLDFRAGPCDTHLVIPQSIGFPLSNTYMIRFMTYKQYFDQVIQSLNNCQNLLVENNNHHAYFLLHDFSNTKIFIISNMCISFLSPQYIFPYFY